jgi:hypothetical protein
VPRDIARRRGVSSRPGVDTGRPGGVSSRSGGDTSRPGGASSRPCCDSSRSGGDTSRPRGVSSRPGADTKRPGGVSGSCRAGSYCGGPSALDDVVNRHDVGLTRVDTNLLEDRHQRLTKAVE